MNKFLLRNKVSIPVAKTDHFLWCRHSLPNSKNLESELSSLLSFCYRKT